ncbi:MAG: general secretion pathway protein G [Parcubacteria group bacterium Gr01-1014_31]|nr:MAG: general secretion pathway protein G [Parcubacteria group bacterium Gr01-1014_31]
MMRQRGFTLIEMLVVVAIIGLLSTLVFIAYSNARSKARDAVRSGDIAQVRKALEVYYNSTGDFPSTLADGEIGNPTNGMGCLGTFGWEADTACATPVFMGVAPRDPASTADVPNHDRPCATIGIPCNYSYARLSGERYELHFRLEVGAGQLGVGLLCATEAGVGPACAHQ